MSPDAAVQASFNPAWASPVNTFLLVAVGVGVAYFARETWLLRQQAIRIAQGSEARATKAAEEITRLAEKSEATLAAITAVGRAVQDKLSLLKVENDVRRDVGPR